MKNFSIFILSFFSCFSMSVAQDMDNMDDMVNDKKWQLGLKGGVNLASLEGDYYDLDYVEKKGGYTSFHFGGFMNYRFNPKFRLQGEIVGSIQGGELEYNLSFNDNDIKAEVKPELPYILFVGMGQYFPVDKFYIEFGPQLNVLFKEDFAYKAYVNNQQVKDEEAENLLKNRLDDSRGIDFALNFGVGYEVVKDLTLYGRYSHGFLSIDSRDEEQRDLKNRVFSIGVSYAIFKF